jgi:hypothetical protein
MDFERVCTCTATREGDAHYVYEGIFHWIIFDKWLVILSVQPSLNLDSSD